MRVQAKRLAEWERARQIALFVAGWCAQTSKGPSFEKFMPQGLEDR